MKTTYKKLVEIQDEQLVEAAKILKPEIYSVLFKFIKAKTWRSDELEVLPDEEVEIDKISRYVPRGTAIWETIMQWSRAFDGK